MKAEVYEYSRNEVAEAAGCSPDVVRMEQKKGTFDTAWGFVRWVMAKRLLADGAFVAPKKEFPNMIRADNIKDKLIEELGYVPDDSQAEGKW